MSVKYIAKSSAIASRLLGGEMMVMSAADSTFFTLNPVATAIWQAADGLSPLSEIAADHVCTEFEADSATAYRDVERFVDELSHYGILMVSDQPFADSATSPTEAA
jgi:Coenzyme PQQ synthesis protein D (PqqD)